ncbi:glycosyltransferase family 25 protein [Aeromonas veronii]|uniref:glycosyltransferase family 25 protein n=1 Tax=Aeromonas veronii TaxID=654 RepID=UPI003004CA92
MERREKMAWLMEHYKIPYTFFDAVDSTRLTKQDLDLADLALAEEYCGHKLSLAEVACALSHIKLYEKQVNEKIERMIILEDDAHIHMNFKGIVDSVSSMSSYDLIYLYHGKAKKMPIYTSLVNGYRLHKYRKPSKKSKRGIMGAVGYILTLDGAKKLLQIAYPIRMPADYLLGRLQLNNLNAYGVEPSCIDVDLVKTTIEDRAYGHYLETNDSSKN